MKAYHFLIINKQNTEAKFENNLNKGKGKVFYGQEPPSGESTTTECGFNYPNMFDEKYPRIILTHKNSEFL